MDDDEWFTLAELTGRLGALVWVEESLAGVLDQWSRFDVESRAAIYFATAASHHRWHGQTLRTCLPTSPQLDADASVVPPTTGWKTTVEKLVSLREPEATGARLKSLVKVVHPWLDREVGALRDLSRPVSDAAVMRWLRFVAIDHTDDNEAAEQLLAAFASRAVRFDEHQLVNSLDLT